LNGAVATVAPVCFRRHPTPGARLKNTGDLAPAWVELAEGVPQRSAERRRSDAKAEDVSNIT
jgi:hypothetical protein